MRKAPDAVRENNAMNSSIDRLVDLVKEKSILFNKAKPLTLRRGNGFGGPLVVLEQEGDKVSVPAWNSELGLNLAMRATKELLLSLNFDVQ